jgi:hypothetical protein
VCERVNQYFVFVSTYSSIYIYIYIYIIHLFICIYNKTMTFSSSLRTKSTIAATATATSKDVYCGYGTTFEAKHWFTMEISGFFGLLVSIGIHLYAFGIVWYQVVLHQNSNTQGNMMMMTTTTILSNILFYVAYVPIAILALLSLYQAAFTNPGAVRDVLCFLFVSSSHVLFTSLSLKSLCLITPISTTFVCIHFSLVYR